MTGLLWFFAAFMVIALVWRLASRRQSLPCPVWLRWLVEIDNPFTRTNRASTIVASLDVLPGMEVIDMGCGPGRVTMPLAAAVGPQGLVVAVDLQPGMLIRAREKASQAGLDNIEYRQAAAGDGQLEQGRFDRALLSSVLGEIPDREAAVRELFEALKPGGLLAVTEVIFDPHFQSQATVKRIAGKVGFQERTTYGNRVAYTLLLERPVESSLISR